MCWELRLVARYQVPMTMAQIIKRKKVKYARPAMPQRPVNSVSLRSQVGSVVREFSVSTMSASPSRAAPQPKMKTTPISEIR